MTTESGNPLKLFPESVAQNVPSMLRKLDCIFLCLLIFGLLTVSKYEGPVQKEHVDHAGRKASEDHVGNLIEHDSQQLEVYAEKNIPILEIIKTDKFILLYLLAVCHKLYGYYMSNSYK